MIPARLRAVAALALAGLLTGACGGTDEARPDTPATEVAKGATTTRPATPATEEELAAPEPGPATTVEQPVATTIPIGLPPSLNVPSAGVISFGGSSSMSMTSTIRGVDVVEVAAFVVERLGAGGWAVDPPVPAADGTVEIAFRGPGAAGTVRLAPVEPDLVDVRIRLGAP